MDILLEHYDGSWKAVLHAIERHIINTYPDVNNSKQGPPCNSPPTGEQRADANAALPREQMPVSTSVVRAG